MTRKILAIYILAVLLLLSIVPTIYFLQSYSVQFVTEKPLSYSGQYHYFNSDDGFKLFARIRGNKSKLPIIFLSDGYKYPSLIFELQLSDTLLNQFEFIFPDYRGYGKSERFKNPGNFSVDHLANDIEALRKSVSADSIILMSHGFGTIIAQQYYQKYSAHLKAQILISPIISYDNSAKSAAKKLAEILKTTNPDSVQSTSYFEMEGYSRDDEVGFFGIAKILAHLEETKLLFNDLKNSEKLDINILVNDGFYSESELTVLAYPSLTIGLLYGLYKADFHDDFVSLKKKTLIICGANDFFSGRQSIEYIAAEEPLDSVFITNSGFYPFLENYNEFEDSILNFLKTM
ncbi:MAG: alpha/beta hydrolase [Calditrichaeota bacterium]|nr:alpha/beta hydrolase [Calditrichota bacterium]